MSAIWLKMLGGFRGHDDDGKRLELTSRKAIALLCRITLEGGKDVDIEHLASLLWEVRNESRARGMLRQTLTSLQNHLPDNVLIVDGESVRIDPAVVHADVLDLRQAFEGSASMLFDAFQLYQGELLEGLDARSEAFDAWLVAERKKLHRQVLTRMHDLLEELSLQRSVDQAIELAVRILSLSPGHQETHHRLIRLYKDSGRLAAAIHQYNACQRALESLGEEMSPEVIALGESLGRRERASKSEGPGALAPIPPGEPALRDAVVLHAAIKSFHEGGDEFLLRAPSLKDWGAAMSDLIRRLGGSLLREEDDAVLAAFSVRAFGTHAEERAARTAVAIRHRLSHLLPDHIDVAIGLASGQAMVSGDRQTLQLVGDVQTRAARLEELANAAEIVVDSVVARVLPNTFGLADTGYAIPSHHLLSFNGRHSVEGQYTWSHGEVSRRSDIRGVWTDTAAEHLRLTVDHLFRKEVGTMVIIRGSSAVEYLNAMAADAEQSGLLVHCLDPSEDQETTLSSLRERLQVHVGAEAESDQSLVELCAAAADALPCVLTVSDGASLDPDSRDAVELIAREVTPHKRFIVAMSVQEAQADVSGFASGVGQYLLLQVA